MRATAAAVALAVVLAACSGGGGDGEPARPAPSTTTTAAAGLPPEPPCPVTAAAASAVVGATLTAAEGCTFLNQDPASTGPTLVQVLQLPFDGRPETVASVRAALGAELAVVEVDGVGQAAFTTQREGAPVVSLVVFEGRTQYTLTLGTAAPRDEALATLTELYGLARG